MGSRDVDAVLPLLPRMEENILLFSMQVNTVSSDFINLEGNDITSLPLTFPAKPFYLNDLTVIPTDAIPDCECSRFNIGCQVEMKEDFINGLEWDEFEPQQLLQRDEVYDFLLTLNGHIYHQHIFPFQLVKGLGILGQAGDYMDTISATDVFIRTGLYDFSGTLMVHCHNLPHEDKGMMTFYTVMNQLDTETCTDLDPKIPTGFIFVFFLINYVTFYLSNHIN